MPNYEYRCTSCENQFEIWQEVGAEPPPCPVCQSEVKKVFHPIRTIYKGSGFYVTDLRAEKDKTSTSAKSSEKSDAPTADAKTESKTEAAPAAKTESKTESNATPSTPGVGKAD